MKTYLDCVPCFLKQALHACRMVTDDESIHTSCMIRVLRHAAEWSFERTPPEMGREIHRIVRQETGNPDPYREVKKHSNSLALELVSELEEKVEKSASPFETAARLAIAGNIIDFAFLDKLDESLVIETLDHAIGAPIAIDHIDDLQRSAERAESILYLGDNAGEIVFDGLFLKQLPGEKVTYVVRGAPVINDATLEDAEIAGLTNLVTVVENGSDFPGTVVEDCSQAFQRSFRDADLVIAKGQGNYETLSDSDREIYYLFKVKCQVAARDAGCQIGDLVVGRKNPTQIGKKEK